MEIKEIPIEEIFADHEFNCRGFIRGPDVVDLAASIKHDGLLSPIIVQPHSNPDDPSKKYRIVAGYRRYTACKINKMPMLPCIIKYDLTDSQARILNLTENLKRKDLNKLQEAKAIWPFFLKGFSEKEIATQTGTSIGWVQIRRYIMDFDEIIQSEIAAGLLTDASIRKLYSIQDKESQYNFVKEIKKIKLSGVRKADIIVEKVKKPTNVKKVRKPEEILEIVEMLVNLGLGGTLATVFGAWCAANIDDYDLHKKIAAELAKHGKTYELPEHVKAVDRAKLSPFAIKVPV